MADEIAELRAENERLRADLDHAHAGAIDRMLAETQRAPARIRELLAENARLRAELEAARAVVDDLRCVAADADSTPLMVVRWARRTLARYDAARGGQEVG
jgi:hypothetical protein